MTKTDEHSDNAVPWTSIIELHRASMREYLDAHRDGYETGGNKDAWAARAMKSLRQVIDACFGRRARS